MSKNFLVCLFVACLAQGIIGETVDDVITELTPKVNAAVNDIEVIIQNGGRDIGLTRATISRNIGLTQKQISAQLGQLADEVNLAQSQANAEGKDISACVIAEHQAVNALDQSALSTCRSTPELDLLGIRLGSLGKTKNVLAQSLQTCAVTPVPAAVRSCIEENLTSAQAKAAAIQDSIALTLANSVKSTKACADTVGKTLNEDIRTISQDLQKCVAGI